MTLKLEWDGLLYGLLAVATIASVTSIAARLAKRLLPRPASFNTRERHLDSRDVLADLISSWQIVPSLLKRDLSNPHYRSPSQPINVSIRRRVNIIFFSLAFITVLTEALLVLSTGVVHTKLLLPDVQAYTFLGRHVGAGIRLGDITERVDSNRCIVNKNFTFDDRFFVEYSESLCVRMKLQRPMTKPMSTFELRTEVSTFDEMKLWIGNVVRNPPMIQDHPFNKTTYAIASAFVRRRITNPRKKEQRLIDKGTALRMARIIERSSGCVMKDARELGDLNSRILKRPANIANYTCPMPLQLEEILGYMGEAVLQGFTKFDYSKSRIKYYNDVDSLVVGKQRRLSVGVRLSRSYELRWFVGMTITTLLGIAMWIWDRFASDSVYPGVGMLSLMSEVSGLDECCFNEVYRTPVVLYASDIESGVARSGNGGDVVKRRTFLTQNMVLEIENRPHVFYIDDEDDGLATLRPRYEADAIPGEYRM